MTTIASEAASDVPAREVALRNVLQVISQSRSDEMPVLETIVRDAARLCDATLAGLSLVNEARSHLRYTCIWGEDKGVFKTGHEFDLNGPLQVAVTIREARIIHTPDLADHPLYQARDPMRVKVVDEAGVRTFLTVPLIRDGIAFGCLNLNRFEVRPFDDADIALVETFAEQAVIAIENVRQFRELQTRLEREEATSNILRVISQSRDNEDPVFDAILESASSLCGAESASLMLVNEARTHTQFKRRFGRIFRVDTQAQSWPLDAGFAQTEAVRTSAVVHEPDLKASALYRNGDPVRIALVDEYGARSALAVPLLHAGQAVGAIVMHRFDEIRAFSDSDIRLVEAFAVQAVIAIENVRQFRELQTRLEREEASREVLQVISASREDTAPVFDVILRNAARLCDAPLADLTLVDDDGTHMREVATWGPIERAIASENWVCRMDSDYSHVVATREGGTVHTPDLTKTDRYLADDPIAVAAVDVEKMRTALAVPLMKAGQGIGCLVLFRQQQKPFLPDEITLVETFAEQAVIAIENVRQFRELQTRLEREEATREVLQVISQSRNDEQPVFDLIVKLAKKLCGAAFAGLVLGRKGDDFQRIVAHEDLHQDILQMWQDGRYTMERDKSHVANAILDCRVNAIHDMAETDFYKDHDDRYKTIVSDLGLRSNLLVPLIQDGVGIGCLILVRSEVKPYNADEISLVEGFAAQAVIAIENVRQFRALEALNAELGDRVEEQVGEIERMGRLRRFLSPQVADAVVSSGDDNLLGSHRAMIAILFCDIRGFTAFCESAEPEETIEVLQTFHETLGRLIHAAGAGFDHRAGDGIMVVFNDPVPCDDPAGAALQVAIAMREKMVDLCGKWRKLGHRMGFGVGISLGYATVGMVGFEGRYDYTASGTAVNLAARLCDQAKDQEILLSQRAATALEDIAEIASAGELTLKGFHAPVNVFKVSEIKKTP